MHSRLKIYEINTSDTSAIRWIELYNESWQKSLMKLNGIDTFIEKIIKR
jgi:hypothetical protein